MRLGRSDVSHFGTLRTRVETVNSFAGLAHEFVTYPQSLENFCQSCKFIGEGSRILERIDEERESAYEMLWLGRMTALAASWPRARGSDCMNKALILKSLLTLLVGLSPGALGEVARLGGVSEEDARSFMRLNAGDRALKQAYDALLTGVRKYIDGARAPWPREVLAVYAMLSDQLQDINRIPFFLDPLSIRDNMNQSRSFDRFLRRYEGCWRILRPSSDSDTGVNRWFLNIWPRADLEEQRQPAPLFSYYFREELGKGVDEVGKVVGLLFPMAERVTFLGQRLSSFNPHLVAMVWPVRESQQGHATHAVGLSLIPNARRDHVASYVWASFIEGSDRWDHETYQREREREMSLVTRYSLDKEEDYEKVAEIVGPAHMPQFEKLRRTRPIVV